MERIEFGDIVQAYLRIVPQAEDVLRAIPDPPRSDFEAWPDKDSDLYDFLPMAFMHPILLPKLREDPVDRETLDACFEFIEGLAMSRNTYVQGALYFEVYEQFLRGREILIRAYEFSRPVARARIHEMLTRDYPGTLEKVREDIEGRHES
ncbi:hypothetical protein ABT063_16970 [Streptomyces sp. NPDC002838]|uniref:hypothetical protein n=1 Tax=Streptomyces sp. NPDC002838 TaxID=3154436 RepID=UPI00332CDEF8